MIPRHAPINHKVRRDFPGVDRDLTRRTALRLDLRRYDLPPRFAARYRPVKLHVRERGLEAFVLDEYGLAFYRRMTTADAVPEGAVWSVVTSGATTSLRLIPGRCGDAIGYLVCEVVAEPAVMENYPVPNRLSYRAKVSIATLRRLLADLQACDQLRPSGEMVRFIEDRIDQLRVDPPPSASL
jgi:hypothetical protein